MAGDYPPGRTGDPQKAFSVSHMARSMDEALRVFQALTESGEVIMAFGATFWSEGYGMLRDRFGTHWMVSAPERVRG